MSAYNFAQFTDTLPDGEALNLWDASFKDIHLYVAESTRIIVDAQWQANLPGIAAAYLGSRYLWWAILMFNGLYDPIADIRPGVVLRIPDKTSLQTFLSSNQAASTGSNYLPPSRVTVI